MRKPSVLLPAALFALIGLPPAIIAQETPKYELFGGYSNVQPGDQAPGGSGHGAIVGGTFYIKENWGISADWSRSWFGNRFDSFSTPDVFLSGESETNHQRFLAGPSYRLLNRRRFSISVRAAAGAMRSGTESSVVVADGVDAEPVRTDRKFTDWRFLTSVGGSFDWKLNDLSAWRVVQPEVLYWRDFGNQTDLRVSTGLVFRFGKK
jgi:hypothetical protein